APRQALAAFEHERAQIQRRAVGENRPFAHSGRFRGHKSAKEAVKTIACGNAGCSGATVVTTLVCYLHTAHEAAGATGTRHSPRPLFSKGASFMPNSGASRREAEKPRLTSSRGATCPPWLNQRRRKRRRPELSCRRWMLRGACHPGAHLRDEAGMRFDPHWLQIRHVRTGRW